MRLKIKWFPLLLLAFCLSSCGEGPLRKSSDWLPNSVGGPIEVRPLPPSDKIAEDFREWIEKSPEAKVLLYEAIFTGATNQHEFEFDVRRADIPMGRPLYTFASFIYKDPTNGTYQIEWMKQGRQKPDFIRVTNKAKKILLELIQTKDVPFPRLQIVAIEGVESRGVLVAIRHERVP